MCRQNDAELKELDIFDGQLFVAVIHQDVDRRVFEENIMPRLFKTFTIIAVVLAFVTLYQPVSAQLLKLDFGRQIAGSPAVTQPGFMAWEGGVSDATPPTATFGPYMVNVAAVGAGGGFFNATDAQSTKIDTSVRDLYRDYFYNNSTVNGNGVTLQIQGLTPDVPYNLTLWSYDANAPNGTTGTVQTWVPFGASTGPEGRITNKQLPAPTELNDPDNSVTIPVVTTTGTIDIFGTSNPIDATAGLGGVRLNAFRINDGASDLLAVDFQRTSVPPAEPSPFQPGYTPIFADQVTSHVATVGSFTITLEGQGFWNAVNAGRLAMMHPDVANFFRDYYYNNSTTAGDGVKLKIEGVQPNTDYDLKLWSYDNDNNSPTQTSWTPIEGTTGEVGSILNDRDDPWPQTLDDHSDVIRVRSTTSTLTIMGTTPGLPATGGTRLNGLELSLAALAGDYNGDGKVNAADYVLWRKDPASHGNDPGGYNAWRANFGSPPGSGAGAGSQFGAVPEPSAIVLLLGIAFAASARRLSCPRHPR
jgi:hypothetical protein